MTDETVIRTSKKCSHPENRRGFDTGIEWCIDCQAIMDEKGNFVHQTAEATDAPQVLSASAECPLCGHEGPHPHTPLEQVIYRNGVKAGKAHGIETPAFTVEELMHEIHAAHAHTMWRNMPDGRSVPNLCQCRFCKSMGPPAQKALLEQPQCSGLCQGHSSEASLSGWLPDANCPVHGLKATLSEPV